MKRALITGITGQDGSYLAELLLQKGYEVHGLVRRASTFNRGRIEHLKTNYTNVHLHYGDVSDYASLFHVIQTHEPDEIYNLAAQSHVGISFDIPEYTADVTGVGVLRILEAMRLSKIESKFYQASSSELYGKVAHVPQDEMTPFHPRSPYACAKAFGFYITKNYRESYGMFAVNGILFNHESPRRGENFVTRKITYSLARMLAGQQKVLTLGNLDAKRDWGYAPEYVEGMWQMLQHSVPDDYVLATGNTSTVREFLQSCLEFLHIDYEIKGTGVEEKYYNKKTGEVIVAVDPMYYRPAEVDLLLGDASKAKKDLGWEAKTTVRDLAYIMLKADCEILGIQL